MTYTPAPTVTIDGVPVDTVLDGATITRGRDTVDTQARAGYALLSLLDLEATTPPPKLNAEVTVDVDDGSDTLHRLFTGRISDTETRVVSAGARGRTAVTTVTATGPLGALHRGTVNPDGYPQQADGDRIAALLEDAARVSWPLVAGTWHDLEPGSWAEFGPPLEVDQPGSYQLAALEPDDIDDPWQAIQQAADDGLGQLTESRRGGIRYTASRGRLQTVIDTGFVELTAGQIVAADLAARSSVVELVNTVAVEYGDGLEVTVADDAAIADTAAVLARTFPTSLTDPADAAARAARMLRLYARPARSLTSLTLAVDDPDLAPADRAVLLDLDTGTPLRVSELPAAIGGAFTGFVESVAWTITRTAVALTVGVSDYQLSEFTVAWADLTDTAWADTDPATTWNTAQELTDA